MFVYYDLIVSTYHPAFSLGTYLTKKSTYFETIEIGCVFVVDFLLFFHVSLIPQIRLRQCNENKSSYKENIAFRASNIQPKDPKGNQDINQV